MRRLAPLILATVCAAASGVAAAIDFTGNWRVHVVLTDPFFQDLGYQRWAVQQTGTQLTVRVDGGSPHGGFIDPMTGDFQVDLGPGPSSPFQCPNGSATGTVAADGQTFTGIEQSYFEHVTPPPGCFAADARLSGVQSLCGNGTIDPGEDCDDGNVTDGDCCSSTCRFEPAGKACDGTGVCSTMSCDGAGTCQSVPVTICGTTCLPGTCTGGSCIHSPAPEGTSCSYGNACATDTCDGTGNCVYRSPVTCPACQSCDEYAGCVAHPQSGCSSLPTRKLRLRSGDPTRHRMALAGRDRSLVGFFSDPVSGPDGALVCVFDVTPGSSVTTLTGGAVPPGGTCSGKPCWRAIRDGYEYRDPDASRAGVSALTLRTSAARGSAVQAKGGGPKLALPASFAGVTDVLVQVTNGTCFETRYDRIDVRDEGRRLTGR